MENKELIISRIKKLLKHAESAEKLGSIQEAETFAKKAQQLLLEYNLEISEVEASQDQSQQFRDWKYAESVSYSDNQSGNRWKLRLAIVLAQNNFCNVINEPWRKSFRVYGNAENVDTVIYLYHFLSVGLLRIAQENHTLLSPERKKIYNRYAYLKDFLLGAVSGINDKLIEQRQQEAAANNKITALVFCNKQALDKYRDEVITGVVTRTSKTVKVGPAYQKGYITGKTYKINDRLK